MIQKKSQKSRNKEALPPLDKKHPTKPPQLTYLMVSDWMLSKAWKQRWSPSPLLCKNRAVSSYQCNRQEREITDGKGNHKGITEFIPI